MNKSVSAIIATAAFIVLSSTSAQSGDYPVGDPPYRLDYAHEPQIESSCLKWNWQQYLWEDHCPIYVHPKAYMYPRAAHALIRAKG
jgi:hypothetical protein